MQQITCVVSAPPRQQAAAVYEQHRGILCALKNKDGARNQQSDIF